MCATRTPSSRRIDGHALTPSTALTAPSSVGCGLISMNVSNPASRKSSRAGQNITGSRRFRCQYDASRRSFTAPVTVEWNGTVAGCTTSSVSPARSVRLGSVMCGLCEAISTLTRRLKTSRAVSPAWTSSTASTSPEITEVPGPLTPASEMRPAYGVISACASSGGKPTTAIAPGPAVSIRRLRSATTCAAPSRVSTPAAYAAATSPTLCPITAAGSTPQERQSAVSATCTAHKAGWPTSIGRVAASRSVRTSSSDQGTQRRSAVSHSSIAARKTGSSPMRSRAMPVHWPP